MQKQTMKKKLSVNRETLRLLQTADVKVAVGGTFFTNQIECRQSVPCSYKYNTGGCGTGTTG
jgi:hypothetical protein